MSTVASAAPVTSLRIGTRRSALALAQTRAVAELLGARGASSRLVEVTTHGDRSASAITEMGGTGVFVSALRERLLAGDLDVAVHSLKDLPTAAADGLVVAAIPPREDPRDAVVSRDRLPLGELGAGASVGTGSPRRAAQLHAMGLDFNVIPVRGNVDTRIGKVRSGELDAVVVARAGLARLDRLDDVSEILEVDRMVPAPGQGALAIECRADDEGARAILTALDDPPTRAVVTAERALLAGLRAGCTAPVGAHAVLAPGPDGDPLVVLHAVVAAARDGAAPIRSTRSTSQPAIRMSTSGPFRAAEQLGRDLAAELLAAGAVDLLGERP